MLNFLIYYSRYKCGEVEINYTQDILKFIDRRHRTAILVGSFMLEGYGYIITIMKFISKC